MKKSLRTRFYNVRSSINNVHPSLRKIMRFIRIRNQKKAQVRRTFNRT